MGVINIHEIFQPDEEHEDHNSDERFAIQSILSQQTQPSDNMELPPLEWTWQETLLSIPLGLIVIGTIVGNFLVLYSAVSRRRSLRLPTHYFVANLALADFLVGVFVMPFLATLQITGRWYFGPIYCELWTDIHFWLCSASILSTTAICIERYIGVRFPLNHKDIMNTRRITGLVLCVWAFAGVMALCSLYIWPQPKSGKPLACDINQQIGHVILAVVGILYIPAVVMIILYWKIYCLASRHLKFMKKHSGFVTSSGTTNHGTQSKGKGSTALPDSDVSTTETSFSSSTSQEESSGHSETSTHNYEKKGSAFSNASSTTTVVSSASSKNLVRNTQSKKQINLARRLSFLVGVLLASYVPFFTLYMVMAFYPGSVDGRVFNAFGWIRYFNSCLNPFIYAYAVPAYRKAMTEIILNGYLTVKKVFTCQH